MTPPSAATGIYRLKPLLQRTLQPLVNALVQRRTSPDWLTYGAVAVAGLMAALTVWAAHGPPAARWSLLLVAALAPVRLALNALDGQVARALGLTDPLGEVKNELGDRVADLLVFGGVVLAAPHVPLALAVAALGVALLTGTVGILSKAVVGVRDYSGVMGKPDRMTALAVGVGLVAFSGQWLWLAVALSVVVLLGLVTIVTRLRNIARAAQPGTAGPA